MSQAEKEAELGKVLRRELAPLFNQLFERIVNAMNKTDLDNALTAAETSVGTLGTTTTNLGTSLDLSTEVARVIAIKTAVDTANSAITALVTPPAPTAPTPTVPTA